MHDIKEWSRTKLASVTLGTLAVVAGVVLLGVAIWPEDSAAAKQNFCNSLSNLSSTVMSYQGLDPAAATNEERDAAYNDISDAWNAVADDANDWANAYDNPLNEAYNDLAVAIDDLPSDYTVAQDLQALEPQLSAFPNAFRETFDGSGCASA
jgi:hypothetical protein